MAIRFYSSSDDFSEFSNFANFGFMLDGKYWPTVEHYFQAQKFPGTSYADDIRHAKSPAKAKSMGRSKKVKLRGDWETVKIDVMRAAIFAKFSSHICCSAPATKICTKPRHPIISGASANPAAARIGRAAS